MIKLNVSKNLKFIEITTTDNELIFMFDIKNNKMICEKNYKVNLYDEDGKI